MLILPETAKFSSYLYFIRKAMGIQNREGALFFATGVDNTGLYAGRREAIGIIKAMASEITSFDVFGGIGISAGIAFARAAKGAYDFEKQFQQSMKEVATISNGIKGSLTDYMNQVLEITRTIPVQANDAAKALYQIVSAGHDGADGMKILEVSAKAAIGGVTDTATAADAITTLINAYKLSASDAERISDQLFTTVRLGKTTFGELGRSIAQAAPVAAAYGVEIDQVLAAVATLTKQGTPTAQAMTQIRAAIVGVSKYLGDGAYNGRTFQEALELVRQKAGGSEAKLREMIPEIEAVNGLLGLTGQNAKEAAGHLAEMENATGASEAAFKEMVSSAQKQLQLLQNNITAALRPMGEAILKEVSDIATAFNKAFENGDVQESMKTLGALIVTVTSAYIGYKGSILAVSAAKRIDASISAILDKQRAIEIGRLVLSKGFYDAETAAVVKNTSARVLLTKALKAQFVASMKASAAILTNPYMLAAGAVAFLGYSVYKLATAENAAEKAARNHNNEIRKQKQYFDDLKKSANDYLTIIKDEAATLSEKIEAYKKFNEIMPEVLKNLDLETLKTMDVAEARKLINNEANRQYIIGAKTSLVLAEKSLKIWENKLFQLESQPIRDQTDIDAINQTKLVVEEQREKVRLKKETVDKINEIQTKAAEEKKKEEEKAAIQNKAFWTRQKDNAQTALESIASSQKKLMDAGKFDGIDGKIVESYKKNTKLLKEAERELKVYDFSSKQENQADKLRQEQEKYKLLLDKNKRDQSRAETDAQHELEQIKIDGLQEGSEKVLRQRKLNHEKELEAIRREAEDRKLKLIENARSEFEADPANAKKIFDAESFAKSEPAQRQFKKIEEIRDIKIRTSNIKYNRGDDLSGLLDEYKDYTDERLAIEKKYNNDIAVLEAQRRQAVKDGNAALIGQIDRAKAQATKDRGKELMRLDYEQLKKSPEYVRAFENLKQTSSETLSSLLSQLEEAKRTAAEVLNPEDLREYTSTIQSIVDELTERNPFQTIIAKKKELARAEQELAKAKKLLDATDKKGYAILADYNEKTGETVYTYLTATEALKKYNEAKDHVIKTDGELQAAEKKVSEQVEELGNALKNIGGIIGGTSGEIISLMGDIYSFTSLSMEGISKLSGEAAKKMSALEKASVILGIIAAAIQLLQQLDSLTGDAHSQYEGYAEKIAEINRLTDAVNEYRLAALEAQQAEEDWFSQDRLGNLRHFRELHEEIADAYDKKANEKQAVYQNEGGGGWLTKTANWVMGNLSPLALLGDKWKDMWGQGGYEEGTAKATDNLRIETRKKSKGFLGTGIGGKSQKTEDLVTWARKNGFGELFEEDGLINKEAGRAILDNYGEKLVGQTKETLEELLELREKYDEYIDQLHEYVNSIYEPLVDNFVDAIFDWLDTGKDALDSFRDYASDTFRNIARDMVKSLVISQIFGTGEDSFQNKVNALYEQYSKGELTEEELNRKVAEETALLGKKAEEKLPVIQKSTGIIADVLEQVAGIDIRDKGGSTSQSSTSGGFQSMSQDSADELNGRLTGVQMGVEEVKEQVYRQTEIQFGMVETMKTLYNLNYEHYTEIQDMTQNSLNILEDINKDTKQLYFIVECLKKIETNTK